MTGALAAITAAGILLPHALHLHRVPPFTAVALWLSSLALRAFACLLAAISLVFFLPSTGLFVALTHWCGHVALPARESPLPVEGHGFAQVALYAPGAVLGASLAWMCVASVREARAARHLIAEHAVGRGPRDCLIVGGSDVLFAAAGLVHPRIMVSAGALAALDDDELAAGLNHEAGHIARQHHFVMLLAVGLRAVGRLVPGGGRALRELTFHLERDADRWALRQEDDRAALASVICKAAAADRSAPPAVAGLGGADVPERLGEVLGTCAGTTRRVRALCTALATGMVILSLLIGAAVPAVALSAAAADPHRGHHRHHCDHGARATQAAAPAERVRAWSHDGTA